MHDIRWIRANPDAFDQALKRRGLEPCAGRILECDGRLKAAAQALQVQRARRNAIAETMAKHKREAKAEDQGAVAQLVAEANTIKHDLAAHEADETALQTALRHALETLPNLAADDVPDGTSENDNVLVRTVGAPASFTFPPKQHFELGEALGMMHFEDATHLSGSRFVLLSGALARLERALAQFMLDHHTSRFGYEEVSPPLLVKESAMYDVGQLPKFGDDAFCTTNGLWLIPTAEVPLTNRLAHKMLQASELPKRFVAHTPCFRSEAGSAGKDTRGMLRQHQFYKVELVSLVENGKGEEEHERMTQAAESVLQALGLPYRVMLLCTQDMGFTAKKTYDLEVWLPGQNQYREISSCSNCGVFQARRSGLRYKTKEGTIEFAETLNGSGVAVGRALIAVLETYQTERGTIRIPEILQPYMGAITEIGVSHE